MDTRIVPNTFTRGFPLKTTSPLLGAGSGNAYQNTINGNNLIRKAAQLVSDIEGLGKKSALKNISLPKLNETSFQKLVDDIKAQLAKTGKPLSILYVLEAQNQLAAKALDTKA